MKAMTVKQVSELTGVSVRTLQYYDDIGLLSPSERTEAGYRLYEEAQLATLQEILLFRELEFPLKDIKAILDNPAYDKERALHQQIELLTLKKERLEGLIRLAEELKNEQSNVQRGTGNKSQEGSADQTGNAYPAGNPDESGTRIESRTERRKERSHTMDFTAFDKTKLEEYKKRAREQYSDTDAYKEYEVKSAGRTSEDEQVFAKEFMAIFAKFGALLEDGTDSNTAGDNAAASSSEASSSEASSPKASSPKASSPEASSPKASLSKASAPEAQALVQELRDYITEHFYTCTPEILSGLGKMYAADGEFKENIDRAGGTGTAEFVSQAIDIYCRK